MRVENWHVVSFYRVACFDCNWNRNEKGEPTVGSSALARIHAENEKHRTFVMKWVAREYDGRPPKTTPAPT